MPANVSPIPKYVDVKCFPLSMELQDTTWAVRVSGETADQAAPYHQMIAFHLLPLRLRAKVRVQRNQCDLWKYPNGSISCFDRRHQNIWLMTCSFTCEQPVVIKNDTMYYCLLCGENESSANLGVHCIHTGKLIWTVKSLGRAATVMCRSVRLFALPRVVYPENQPQKIEGDPAP